MKKNINFVCGIIWLIVAFLNIHDSRPISGIILNFIASLLFLALALYYWRKEKV
ncbi:MAG: hypothetical protein N4A63_06480 [Vallitalea sp.]|jgi:putative Ca2+/H+ antiporter (TMEM165/GDT1 family)|nr:hypothetical protein [Vallitalea sp.]